MSYIVQVDFKMEGPFGDEMANAFAELADSINQEEGFVWKIWTESLEDKEAGGIYLFKTKETAKQYLDMHTKRLASFGIDEVNSKIFEVNTKLTKVNNGPVQV